MSDVTICRACGLPRFHGPAGYAGAQCLCQWRGATLPQMYDELMAKNAALEAENARLTAQIAPIQGGMGEAVEVVAHVATMGFGQHYASGIGEPIDRCIPGEPLMTVAQHQRISAAMTVEVERLQELCECNTAIMRAQDEALSRVNKERTELHAECERLRSERDAFRDSRNYLIEEISSHLSEIAELREALRDTARWIERLPVQAQGAIRQLERIDAALAGSTGQERKDDDHEL